MSDYERVAGGRWGMYRKKRGPSWIWIILGLVLVLWLVSDNRRPQGGTSATASQEPTKHTSRTTTQAPAGGSWTEFYTDPTNESGRIYGFSELVPRDTVAIAGEWHEHRDRARYRGRAVKCSEVGVGRFFETEGHHYRLVADQTYLVVQPLPSSSGGPRGKCWIHENWRYSPSRNHLQLWRYDDNAWGDIGVIVRSGVESTPLPKSTYE